MTGAGNRTPMEPEAGRSEPSTGEPPESWLLAASDVVAGYGEMDVLHRVSIHVCAGEIVTIIGPNGSGKSTLLKAIVSLVRVKSGTVTLAGEDVTNIATEEIIRRGLGYVPQVENIFAGLTIRENLEIGAYLNPASFDAQLEQVCTLFPLLGERLSVRAGTLSGGERQTLAVARALMLQPRLLLLDEPSAALAPQAAHRLFEKITEIAAGGTSILMVEQNAHLALSRSDRAYVLAMGRNELEGEAESLLHDAQVGQIYLGREAE